MRPGPGKPAQLLALTTQEAPMNKTMEIDGVTYVQASTGNRAVVVVDRGWVFAGDVEEKDGRIILTRVVWVFRWSGIGFDGVIANPGSDNVQLRKLDNPVDIPLGTEIFRVPVSADWGL
jgi:hypothetical protein